MSDLGLTKVGQPRKRKVGGGRKARSYEVTRREMPAALWPEFKKRIEQWKLEQAESELV